MKRPAKKREYICPACKIKATEWNDKRIVPDGVKRMACKKCKKILAYVHEECGEPMNRFAYVHSHGGDITYMCRKCGKTLYAWPPRNPHEKGTNMIHRKPGKSD